MTRMHSLQENLEQLQEKVSETGDKMHGEKLEQLCRKASSAQLSIAFCGHFSAGKSTLINTLCGTQLLPSSPIPTSANIVSIRKGEPGASITVKNTSDKGTHEIEVPLDELEAHCKNGIDVETVEIRYPIPLIDDHVILLDTPGIDSTDDAHLMATESALHLADVVFYVMDYNHVQSEINFEFTKRLKDWGKPLYLIVNQIDKHAEEELSFAEYSDSVNQAFKQWHIEPEGILYLSLRQPSHAYNEWDRFLWLFTELQKVGEPVAKASLLQSVNYVIEQHGEWNANLHEAEKLKLKAEIDTFDAAEVQVKLAAMEQLNKQILEIDATPLRLQQIWKAELTSILDNANLTPAATRDLAQVFLECRKPGFKVGLLFSSAKTSAEIERRERAFFDDLIEQVNVNVDWHIRNWLKAACESLEADMESLYPLIEEGRQQITISFLASLINTGASLTNEYTMNYAKQISSEIKSIYRKQGLLIIEELLIQHQGVWDAQKAILHEEYLHLQSQLGAYDRLKQIELEERQYVSGLLASLPMKSTEIKPLLPRLEAYIRNQSNDAVDVRDAFSGEEQQLPVVNLSAWNSYNEKEVSSLVLSGQHVIRNKDETRQKLQQAVSLIEPIAAMKSFVASMKEKAERLHNNEFTIALFGAFSAGKSSFANALVGERVLPVSPNPTTAAINKIVPPEPNWPHGTAKVNVKTREAMVEDILYSLSALGQGKVDSDDFLSCIRKLTPVQLSPKGKPHYAFVKAVEKGWLHMEPLLGTELRLESMEDFAGYVAEEEKSCFVDWMELYYSSLLSEQGIVLVDTPGADSINARHTGVAFNYIKNADAILFVTYYNHAFSQADREFLLQLGRVKDSFAMDKMFFIVNASDLAASAEELDGVVAHVRSNLLQYGIRNPRIYPVSSKLAVDAKQQGDIEAITASGLTGFEREFMRFTVEELSQLAIVGAEAEITRAASVMEQWLDGAKLGEKERTERIQTLEKSVTQSKEAIKLLAKQPIVKDLEQEIQELLYYVKQRNGFRFGDFYHLSFNPSSLQEDGRDIKKALLTCWRECVQLISYDLSQEILATTLRIESFMNNEAESFHKRLKVSLKEQFTAFETAAFESLSYATPKVEETLQAEEPSVKSITEHFKSAKHFFEGVGKSNLREVLDQQFQVSITSYIEQHTTMLLNHYLPQLESAFVNLTMQRQKELEEYSEGILLSLQMKLDVNDITERYNELKSMVTSKKD